MSDDEVQLPPARLGPGRDARTPGKPADGEPGANLPEGATGPELARAVLDAAKARRQAAAPRRRGAVRG
ncbi:DUF721 domain-containing protein, partial [Micromonospora chalcea]